MKKIISVLVFTLFVIASANAEVMVTANPLGQGALGWLGAAQSNATTTANSNSYNLGGFIGYGINDKLDVFGKLAYGTGSNTPSGISANGIEIGVAAKYLLATAKDMPADLAVGLSYKSKTTTLSGLVSSQTVVGDLAVAVIASKVIIPWVPYCALAYHSLSSSGTTGSNLELALGGQMLLSASSAVMGEIAFNNENWSGATSTSTQITVGYNAKI